MINDNYRHTIFQTIEEVDAERRRSENLAVLNARGFETNVYRPPSDEDIERVARALEDLG
jgi:hypothetical protein